jgi:hypothetical protein
VLPSLSYTVINLNLNSILGRILFTYLDMNELKILHISDNTFRILCPMILYVSDDKNDVYGVFISTALQQKCLHTSGFINGSCMCCPYTHVLSVYTCLVRRHMSIVRHV